MIIRNEELKWALEDWVRSLNEAEPVGEWVSRPWEELGINFCGNIEIRVHRIGDSFVVVTKDPTSQYAVDSYSSLGEVSNHLKHESERGNPEDGWQFSLKEFNRLPDRYDLVPDSIKGLATPAEIVALLTDQDDDVWEWLFDG